MLQKKMDASDIKTFKYKSPRKLIGPDYWIRDETCYYLAACFLFIQANGFFLKSRELAGIDLSFISFR